MHQAPYHGNIIPFLALMVGIPHLSWSIMVFVYNLKTAYSLKKTEIICLKTSIINYQVEGLGRIHIEAFRTVIF